VQDLSWISSIGLFFNGVDVSEGEEEIEKLFYEATGYTFNVDIDAGRWYNFPILTGIKFQNNFLPEVAGFGIFQIGLNITKAPNYDLTKRLGSRSANGEGTNEMSTSLGFCFGGGLVFNDKFVVNLMYNDLGKPEFDQELKFKGESETFKGEIKQKISLLLFYFGIKY